MSNRAGGRRKAAAWPVQPWGMRTMWVLAMFDLPTESSAQRRAYARFRKDLLEDGFSMMQYSVYKRHCASYENARAHVSKLGKAVPSEGEVRFLIVTDKQYGRIETFWGKKRGPAEDPPAQLEFF
jgi:CRISPR-associated protein Cas2